MNILGVETTAHTFGVGIVNSKGKVFANVRASYTSRNGGMIPHEIAEHHEKVAEKVLQEALQQARLAWQEINFIAYSAGPGLDPALWKGYGIVKMWARRYHKKIVGVNHPAAHLSIGKMWNTAKDPCYLYVSGVNTQVIVQEGGKYRVVGETLDIGLGNMLDKLGRILGLGFPAGPTIEELAQKGSYVELPYVVKGMDVSFSGILTKCEQIWEKKLTRKAVLQKQGRYAEAPYVFNSSTGKIIEHMHCEVMGKVITKEELCFSVQETCFAMLAEVAERAMAQMEKKELILVGGVGANKRFAGMLDLMCKARGAKFYNVPSELAGDNGAMIAWEGYLRRKESGDIEVRPHWRVDEV